MILQYKNKKYKLEATKDDDNFNFFNISIDNKDCDLKIQKKDDTYFIYKDGHYKEVHIAKDNKHIYVLIDSFQYVFDLINSENFYSVGINNNSDKFEKIISPMPGSIVSVLVNENDVVEIGTPLIIIEAMKMETKLYSSINGKISKIYCKNGEQVDSVQTLVEISSEI